MSRELVVALLTAEPDLHKEIIVVDGSRYRVRKLEEWSAVPGCLTVLMQGDMVYIAYRNIAAIRVIREAL